MGFAGTVTSSALLLLIFLWAEGQPVKGFMPKNGGVVSVGNDVTATGAAQMCNYPKSLVDGEPKTVIDDDASVLLLPEPADRRAPAAGVLPREDKKGLRGQAKAWCCWLLTVALTIVVFVARPETFLVSPRTAADPARWWNRAKEQVDLAEDQVAGLMHRSLLIFNGASWEEAGHLLGVAGRWLRHCWRRINHAHDIYCAICMETVPGTLKFSVGTCGHTFCSSCVAQYVTAKLVENLARVECPDPGCGGVGAVEPESCAGIISTDLLDKWGFLLCESALGAKKVYCPYKECSAPLLADGQAQAAIAEAECPHCHRLFCARCAAPWHDGVGCTEFQKLGHDERGRADLLLRRLAGQQRWQRCPRPPAARCTWRNRKGATTSSAGADTASATDVHPRCPRKPVTATSARASDLFVMDRELPLTNEPDSTN